MTTSVKGATYGYAMESRLIGLISILEIPLQLIENGLNC